MNMRGTGILLAALWASTFAAGSVDAPAKPAAASAGPRPASVLFVGGMKIEKCWADEKPNGAWIIYDGQRYWYLRESIQKIDWLAGEPDGELKDWLKKAEENRKKEEERAQKADEEREKKALAEESTPPPPSGGSAGSSSSAPSGSANAGGARSGVNQAAETNGGSRKAVGGDASGGTARGKGYAGVVGSGGTGTGIVGGDGIHLLNGQLGYQWRVKDVNRKENTIRIKNRLFNEQITLKVADPDDLKHVKAGQILTGMLTAQEPVLNAPDGTPIEFELAPPAVKP